jgi:hypothetical protein
MKTPEQITDWLKGQRLYDKFVQNYNRGVRHRMTLATFLKKTPAENVISSAFVWHDTHEGNRYWCRINNNFLKWIGNEKDNVQR